MNVIRAGTAGFCMGVSLALKKLEAALREKPGKRIRTLGPIIHNPQVLADFAARGVVCLNDMEDVGPSDHVLIRAHGIPRQQELRLRRNCLSVADATCPRVKKAQLAIAAATAEGQSLLLFGEADHPEVVGLVSYASGPAFVFDSIDFLRKQPIEDGKGLVLASQTTQDRVEFEKISKTLAARFPDIMILSTICDATRERQEEALAIASRVDAMLVIGGRQSGNTRRLASLASETGISTFHVETIAELDPRQLGQYGVIGLTAGASTPARLIDEAEEWLRAL